MRRLPSTQMFLLMITHYRHLVLVDEAGQQEALSEDTAPMRLAVAFSRSKKDFSRTISHLSCWRRLWQYGFLNTVFYPRILAS